MVFVTYAPRPSLRQQRKAGMLAAQARRAIDNAQEWASPGVATESSLNAIAAPEAPSLGQWTKAAYRRGDRGPLARGPLRPRRHRQGLRRRHQRPGHPPMAPSDTELEPRARRDGRRDTPGP